MSARNTAIVDEVNAAFAANKFEGFLGHCTNDVVWTMVGDRTVSGVDAIRNWLSSMPGEAPKFTVDHVSGDGDTVTAYGDMTMKGQDGSAEPMPTATSIASAVTRSPSCGPTWSAPSRSS